MLPSEFTPSDLRQTEIFIRGTEPTARSNRFEKLKDVTNLKQSVKDNKVTLTWDPVKTPDINTEEYLRQYFRSVFQNDGYLNNYINSRLNYINSYIGSIEYSIYVKDEEGKLELLDSTAATRFETEFEESGDYTLVVKTNYSIFKDNRSDGSEIKVSVVVNKPIVPIDDDPIEPISD